MPWTLYLRIHPEFLTAQQRSQGFTSRRKWRSCSSTSDGCMHVQVKQSSCKCMQIFLTDDSMAASEMHLKISRGCLYLDFQVALSCRMRRWDQNV
mmetsp:Transcript_102992/g.177710  ORF Transcript_102992/g.177710 Transcript_102992/m.177710 type:complete len:95 (+) Transcript_102992:904-1188(+)